jgi:hypothetical protein
LPQLFASVVVSTQTLLQFVGALLGHEQIPFVHSPPFGQALPHLPQLKGSVLKLAQPFMHNVCEFGHMHIPPAQVALFGQAFAHLPQLELSVCMFVHELEQQSGVPFMHVVLQLPQFFGSDVVSTHMLEQTIRPPSQVSGPASLASVPVASVASVAVASIPGASPVPLSVTPLSLAASATL